LKLSSKLNNLLNEETVSVDELVGKTFEIVKTNKKKLIKRKKPITLIKHLGMLMDSSKNWGFAYISTIVKTGDMYAIREDTPIKKNIVTILKEIK